MKMIVMAAEYYGCAGLKTSAAFVSFKPPESCVLAFEQDGCSKTAAEGWTTRKKQPSAAREHLLTEIEAHVASLGCTDPAGM